MKRDNSSQRRYRCFVLVGLLAAALVGVFFLAANRSDLVDAKVTSDLKTSRFYEGKVWLKRSELRRNLLIMRLEMHQILVKDIHQSAFKNSIVV